MNKNYKLFNINGLLLDGNEIPVSKGNKGVDVFYFHFEGYNYLENYVTVAVTLPDGTALPELGTANDTFEFKGKKYNGYKIVLLEPLTAQAGILTMTIDLINNTNNTKLCSSQLKITIHDSDTPTVPTIEEAQYHQLLQTINDNYNTLNETKLYKNFTEYESETNVNSDDLVAINKNGETKNAKLEDVYNIKTVNNVAPTNKNVTITSANIPHEDTTISDKLVTLEDSLNNKANVEDTVFFRDGGFIDDGLISTGLLNLTTDSHDVFGRIFLTETKFIGGDILTCDLELQITETTGGTYIHSERVSITRVLDGSFMDKVFVRTQNGYNEIELEATIENNMLAIRAEDRNDMFITIRIVKALVRR